MIIPVNFMIFMSLPIIARTARRSVRVPWAPKVIETHKESPDAPTGKPIALKRHWSSWTTMRSATT